MHGGKAMVKIFERAGVDYIFSSPERNGRRSGRRSPKQRSEEI